MIALSRAFAYLAKSSVAADIVYISKPSKEMREVYFDFDMLPTILFMRIFELCLQLFVVLLQLQIHLLYLSTHSRLLIVNNRRKVGFHLCSPLVISFA
jgi:hypothetical protein